MADEKKAPEEKGKSAEAHAKNAERKAAKKGEPEATLYVTDKLPGEVDPVTWPASGYVTDEDEPRPTYYFAGDTEENPAAGEEVEGFEVYDGGVEAMAGAEEPEEGDDVGPEAEQKAGGAKG